jgi:hypothetical protein
MRRSTGFRGNTKLAAYQASKGGVVALTYSVAIDYASQGIRCNAVCPGTIQTPMVGTRPPDVTSGDDRGSILSDASGKPEDVAWLACFLASDRASFLTGLGRARGRRPRHSLSARRRCTARTVRPLGAATGAERRSPSEEGLA